MQVCATFLESLNCDTFFVKLKKSKQRRNSKLIQEFLTSCFLVVAAEMGDKSQILAMTFATKYSVYHVLLGIIIGITLNHGLAVAFGTSLSKLISLDIVRLAAGIAFIVFALWSLIQSDEDEPEAEEAHRFGPIVTVAMAFFIGELGDKTQLTAITLASSSEHPLIVLLGTVSGMVLTSAIGIFVGSRMGQRIPEFAMKIVSSFVFLGFGLISLYQNLPDAYLTPANIIITIIALGLVVTYLVRRAWIAYRSQPISPLRAKAQHLHEQLVGIKDLIDDLCIKQPTCQKCDRNDCLLEITRRSLGSYLKHDQFTDFSHQISKLPIDRRNFDIVRAREAYCRTVVACLNCQKSHQSGCILNETRQVLERICFNKTLPFAGNMQDYLMEVERESPVLAGKIRRLLTTD